MELSAIVACSKNRVIGIENKLPWHIPEDTKFFRNTTKNHVMIMGRKTFESLGKPLPSRFHIVITRQSNFVYDHPLVKVVKSLDEAVQFAPSLVPLYPEEIFVIGGGEIYLQSLGQLDKVYLTLIDSEIKGDAYFPNLPEESWKLISQRIVPGEPSYSFQVWKAERQ